MTISAKSTGSVLYFSHDELRAACLTPDRLTEEDTLALIRTALAKARRPVPDALEVKSFASQDGVLFFVIPRLPESGSTPVFPFTFS